MSSLSDDVLRKAAREAVYELVGRTVPDGELIISGGLIDSLSVLKLISSLEKKLHVKIPTRELQPEDFDGVQLMVETLRRVAT